MFTARALLAWICLAAAAQAEVLTLTGEQRPEWLARDGIVMAGSWEPLLFRVRRDGGEGYTPSAEQIAAYHREQSPAMIAQLKALGVNFVMMHCYKGGGMQAERESMADAVQFAKRCREAGLRVGVYNYSGAFIWELFFKEKPEAQDWVLLKPDGSPVTYGKAQYRYYWNRNHPQAQAYYRQLVRFAVEDIQTDLIHFDNHNIGPGYDANSAERFRQYVQATFSAEQLRQHGIDPATAQPPKSVPKELAQRYHDARPTTADPKSTAAKAEDPLLARAWTNFCCQSLADSYHDMNRYARSLRRDILVECNPAGVRPTIILPVDHGRLLSGGEAIWDESAKPRYAAGVLTSRIRTYKVTRRMNNSMFAYVTSPLEAAESLAFNLDCLGAICWFEYGQIVNRPGQTAPVDEAVLPYVRFFHRQRALFRDARVVADLAVIRSFPSMVFGEPATARLTGQVEEALILHRRPFQILYKPQLDLLPQYKLAVLAGCAALGDRTVEQIRRFVQGGGRLCVIGPLATHDEWMLPRKKPALDDLPAKQVVRAAADSDWLAAIHQACGGPAPLSIAARSLGSEKVKSLPFPLPAAAGLCCELTEQPQRRMLHLVNFRDDGPVSEVAVDLQVPAGKKVHSVQLLTPAGEAAQKLPFQTEGASVRFTIPQVEVYALAVVQTD